MITLVCRHCGCSNSDLNPRCRECGRPLPEVSNAATVQMTRGDAVDSELASRSVTQAAHRYERLTELARGGSGRIVAARDLVFERSVVIKEPLDPARDGPRLCAEAEILACLQHPSIVPVYDIGVWRDGTPFFAMKLVEGRSLLHVIREAPTLEQRIALIPHLIAVAEAMAYAHAQGVIHRDLKPGNVLVGQFGETMVIDWGLAKRVRADVAPEVRAPATGTGRVRMAVETATGAVLGTPAYMAPEQARGEPVDERADVYALGALLYHLLTGDAPFRDATGSDLIAAVGTAGPTRVSELQPRAPADLAAIVAKAMARDPADRYPSAAELADDLRRFQTGRLVTARRYSLIDRLRYRLRTHRSVAIGVLVGTSVVAALAEVPSPPPPGLQCARSGDRIHGVWDPDLRVVDRRIAVRAALLGNGRPSAEDTFARVTAALDRYSRDWVAARVEACEATQVRGEQSDALLDLRMACLDQRLDDLDALVHELGQPRPEVLDKAVEATFRLPPLSVCADVRALQATIPPPVDPVARAAVDAARRKLSSVKALATTGAYRDGLALARAAVNEAEPLGYAPLLAEALYWRARLEEYTGDSSAAEATQRLGLIVAADGHADVIAVWLWARLIFVVGDSLRRPDEALAMRTAAEAAVHRAGSDPDGEAQVLDAIGTALRAAGKYEASLGYTERALALHERVLGTDHLEVAITLVNLSNAKSSLDQGEAAQAALQRASAIFERALGPDHPNLAFTENNLGGVYYKAGKYILALQSFERAVAIRERVLGPNHVKLGPALVNRAMVSGDLGRTEDAVRDLERAVTIFEARGPDHPDVAEALYHLGVVRIDQRKFDDARRDLERALTIAEHALGSTHPDLGFTLVNLGELAWERGDHVQARQLLGRVQAIWHAALGPDHADLGFVAEILAQVALSEGKLEQARSLAERALKLQNHRALERARCQLVLARVLWTWPAERSRARELARLARETYARLGAEGSRRARDLATWMTAHDVR
jgi:serine/threonine protein kinase/tetratricopeptide (TPR) repeat protein